MALANKGRKPHGKGESQGRPSTGPGAGGSITPAPAKGGKGKGGRTEAARPAGGKGRGSVGGKGGKGGRGVAPTEDGDRGRRTANLAWDTVWRAWERFKAFEGRESWSLVDHDTSRVVAEVLLKRDLSSACTWLSICAQLARCNLHPSGGACTHGLIKSLGERNWKETSPEGTISLLREWARKANASVAVFRIKEDGDLVDVVLETLSEPGAAGPRPRWDFLLLPSTAGGHVLPFAMAQSRPTSATELFPPAATPVPSAPEAQATSSAADCAAAEAPTPDKHDGRTSMELLEQAVVTLGGEEQFPNLWVLLSATRDVVDPQSVELAEVCWVDEDDPSGGDEPSQGVRPKYFGQYPPLPFMEVDWIGGAWAACSPGTQIQPLVWPEILYAAATTECAARFLDEVLYVPWRDQCPLLQRVGQRTLVSGNQRVQLLGAGDAIQLDGHWYRAHERPNGLLRLERVSKTSFEALVDEFTEATGLRSVARLWRRAFPRTPRVDGVEPALPAALPSEVARRMEWAALTPNAPQQMQAALGVVRNTAAMGQYGSDTVRAHDAATHVRILTDANASVPFSYCGGGPGPRGSAFKWGYCYSCGGQPDKKRLPGRLCGCPATPSAVCVAKGLHCCGVGQVCYPGVVQTYSQHPPLKRGKESLATEQGFRVAPLM
jgi:hypothetical protein